MNIKDFIIGYLIGKGDGGGGASVEPLTVTENGEYSEEGVAYSPVTVNVPASGGWTKIATAEFNVNTTSATATDIGTIDVGKQYYSKDYILWVNVRDKAGKREGYYFGTDSFILNAWAASGLFGDYSDISHLTIRYQNSQFEAYVGGMGVYPYYIDRNGIIQMRSRYSSSFSKTIDGTYVVDVYAYESPVALFGE